MYITLTTDEYNDTLSINNNCTKNENNIAIFIPSLLLTLSFGLPFLCLMSLIVNTLLKPLLSKK